jgi:BCD family chlorophyll transporter-like MFS transporter
MQHHLRSGVALAVLAYVLVGIGIAAAGTANLALLSKRVEPGRRPLVAALVWIMMIAGFSVSAGLAGHFLQPFSARRLIEVFAGAGALAFALGVLAVRGIETRQGATTPAARPGLGARIGSPSLRSGLRQLWAEPAARRFTVFLFVSMLAFSAQELLLEPFAGLVFGFAPAASARLAGLQNAGVVAGMLLVVLAALLRRGQNVGFSLHWMIGGTSGSAVAVAALALIAARGLLPMLAPAAVVLGLANGAFAVAAIGVMMDLSSSGGRGREGLRMGVWGAAQALAFAAGGLSAGAAVDLSRWLLGSASSAYVLVFCLDAALFVVAIWWALRLSAAHVDTAAHVLVANRGVAG